MIELVISQLISTLIIIAAIGIVALTYRLIRNNSNRRNNSYRMEETMDNIKSQLEYLLNKPKRRR